MIHGGHTSHAMILQMQEYRERVQNACQSTYQFPLQNPHKPSLAADGKKRKTHKGYCRSHVLATTKQFFHAREPTTSHFSVPVDLKDRILPKKGGDVYINFHQTKPRKDEFLFGDHGNTRPKIAHDGNSAVGIAKDHFALGPGQYDVTNIYSKTTTSVKFSPSDRFHENFSTDKLGPGQYITNEELTTPRAAVAVFSQTPRRTEAALLVSPTANVSSYYYVPESSFLDKNAPENDNPSWPRSVRLASQRRTTTSIEAQQHRMAQATTDYIAKNKSHVSTQSAVQRLQKARELQGRLQLKKRGENGDDGGNGYKFDQLHMAPPPTFKRRSSIFLNIGSTVSPAAYENLAGRLAVSASFSSSKNVTSLTRKPSGNNGAAAVSAFSQLIQENNRFDKSLRGWVTLTCIASFSVRMGKIFHLIRVIRAIQEKERQQLTLVVFSEWKKFDRARSLQYSTQLIMRNCFMWRLHVRIKRKGAHVSILRKFLSGLSIDVQFAIAMKKIKRKIQLIQRWWRHVQLMVKAREEALYYKWINVETHLRLEYINQMPHLQRIFQQPSSLAVGSIATGGGANSVPGGVNQASTNGDLTLQKLLNLPEQKKWFTARFVLTSDGCLRGYSNTADTASFGDSKETLVVEVKNYRCNFHESVLSSSDGTGELLSTHLFDGSNNNSSSTTELSMTAASLQAYQNYSNARWKPFLMVFRQGAFRFVLLTSTSPMPTEILSWRDKLERLVMTPASSGVFGSISGASSSALSTSGSSLEGSSSHSFHHGGSGNFSTVSEFVEVSMQSGILSTNSHHHAPPLSALHGGSGSDSFGGSISLSAASSLQLEAALAGGGGSSRNMLAQPRGKLQARVRSIRQRNRMGLTVSEGELTYYVVDLLKDFPKVPATIVWQTIREKLREKRKSFRAEIYRYNLEMYHFHRHQEQTKHIHVLDKFKEFFVSQCVL